MHNTSAMSTLKSMLPRIHHPLPLSKHDQQQLLNTLTTSFRRNLDKEHGFRFEDTPALSRIGKTPSPLANDTPGSPPKGTRHTDSHVRAILSNPLFASRKATAPSLAQSDPVRVFDEAVRRGMMTLQRAAGCLKANQQRRIQSTLLPTLSETHDHSLGLRVVRWLRHSGLANTPAFHAAKPLHGPLIRHLFVEGHEEIIWSWIESLLATTTTITQLQPQPQPQQTAARFLVMLIVAKNEGAETLDEAYKCILRANHILSASKSQQQPIRLSWNYLSWMSTVNAWERDRPTAALFDSFVAMKNNLSSPWLSLDRAHLALHHPTTPTSDAAVDLLHSEESWAALDNWKAQSKDESTDKFSVFGKRLAFMGVDAVRSLTRSGLTQDAHALLQLMSRRLDRLDFTESMTPSAGWAVSRA